MPQLYVAYLGGKMPPGRIGEDHETVLVVAEDPAQAKLKARAKWQGIGAAHLDMLSEISTIDGYKITLKPGARESGVTHNDDWKNLNS